MAHLQNGCAKENAENNRNFHNSTSRYHRYTPFTSRYMFLGLPNTVILVKKSVHIKNDFKIQDGLQFWPKNRSRYETTNMPVPILP